MKSLTLRCLTLAALLAPLTGVHAAFDSKIVSADAQWVVYLDLATFRESTIGKELVATAIKIQSEQNKSNVQVDIPKLLTTLGSVTAYGSNFSNDPKQLDGTLVVQGTADLRKIAEGYIAQATVSSPESVSQIKDFPIEAYSIGKGDQSLVIAFPPEPIIMVSKSKAQLLKAREVVRGGAPSLSKASGSPLRALLSGDNRPYLVAASVVPGAEMFPEGAPQARILQMAKSAAVSLGETPTHAFAHIELLASSDETADKLLKIVQGFAAMASLAESSDKALTEFLQSIAVKRDAKSVTLDLSYPSERLLQMVRELDQGKSSKAPNKIAKVEGKVIDEWVADQDLGFDGPNTANLVYRTIENVALTQGSTLILTGSRDHGEHARIDVVEITPSAGGQALRFEAENMLLRQYERENVAFASAGKLIKAHGEGGSARLQFPAGDGSYTIKVRYLDENDGQSSYSLRLKAPEAAEAEE